jgi:hypothetical protein
MSQLLKAQRINPVIADLNFSEAIDRFSRQKQTKLP